MRLLNSLKRNENLYSFKSEYKGKCCWLIMNGKSLILSDGRIIGDFEVYRQESDGTRHLNGHEFEYENIRDYLLNFEFDYKIICPYSNFELPDSKLWDDIQSRLKQDNRYQWDKDRPAIALGNKKADFSGRHLKDSEEWTTEFREKRRNGFYTVQDWAQEFYNKDGLSMELDYDDFDKFVEIAKKSGAQLVTQSLRTASSNAIATYILDINTALNALSESGLAKKYPRYNEDSKWKFI